MRWRVTCNGARWSTTQPTLAAALAAIGQLSERAGLNVDRDWKIEITREK